MVRLLLIAAILAMPIAIFMPEDVGETAMAMIGAGYAVAVFVVWWSTGRTKRRIRSAWR